jgi:hypothetical protein
MKPGRKKAAVDVQLMFRLWNNNELSATDIAAALGVSRSTMRNIAATYGLRCRKTPPRHREEDCAPSLADELRSLDSLALSPWVAARAEMFRKEKERQGEPARLEIGVTTLVTAGPRRRLARME